MDILNTKNATTLGRNINTRKLLERKVRQHGDKPYIIFIDKDDNEEILTYKQLDETVNRLGNWLLKMGIKKGDFVLTHLPNSTGFVVSLHACTKIGAIMIPSIIFDVAEDLEYKLNFSETKMVITDGEYYPIFDSIRSKCPSVKDILPQFYLLLDLFSILSTESLMTSITDSMCFRCDLINSQSISVFFTYNHYSLIFQIHLKENEMPPDVSFQFYCKNQKYLYIG